jgi:hypothetical protein
MTHLLAQLAKLGQVEAILVGGDIAFKATPPWAEAVTRGTAPVSVYAKRGARSLKPSA